jgi:hypothetical protein
VRFTAHPFLASFERRTYWKPSMFRPCKDVKGLISTDKYNLNIHPETAYINSDLNSGIQKKDKVNLGQKMKHTPMISLKNTSMKLPISIIASAPVRWRPRF